MYWRFCHISYPALPLMKRYAMFTFIYLFIYLFVCVDGIRYKYRNERTTEVVYKVYVPVCVGIFVHMLASDL